MGGSSKFEPRRVTVRFQFSPPPSAMAAMAKKVQIDIVSDIF